MRHFSIGAVLDGLLSSVLLPLFGWQSVFLAGGLLPLLIVVALVIRLPESARFLMARNRDPVAVARIMQRLAPSARITLGDRFSSNAPKSKGLSIRELFTHGRAVGTILI